MAQSGIMYHHAQLQGRFKPHSTHMKWQATNGSDIPLVGVSARQKNVYLPIPETVN